MEKRIKKLESLTLDDPVQYIRDTYALWRADRLTQKQVQARLEPVFVDHPDWRYSPPGAIKRPAYLAWQAFTGYKHNI